MASRSWNHVELMGNLTRDPELRYTASGSAVCSFGLATNRSYLVDGERKEEADFHRIVAWNKLAELCSQLLKKGSRVFLSGRIQYREWTGQDNVKHRETEIVIEDMIQLTPKISSPTGEEVLSAPKPAASQPAPAASTDDPVLASKPTGEEDVASEDLPF